MTTNRIKRVLLKHFFKIKYLKLRPCFSIYLGATSFKEKSAFQLFSKHHRR